MEKEAGFLKRVYQAYRKVLLKRYGVGLMLSVLLIMAFMFSNNLVYARAINCSDSPTALWDFEEGSGIYTNDSCNQNYIGTIYGYPDWVQQGQGMFGSGALNFQYNLTSGSNYADFGYILQDTYQNYSISLWVKRNGINEINSDQRIFELGTYWAGTHIEMTMMGFEYSAYTDTGFTGNVMLLYTPNITNGEWDNLITTFNGTDNNLSTYMNGEIIGSIIASTNSLTVGETLLMSASHWDWNTINASVDNIAFFNRTLTPEEVADYSSCTSDWYCSSFANNCSNYWNECTEVKDRSCGRIFTGNLNQYKKLCGDMNTIFTTNADYPYVDCNSTQTFGMAITINNTKQNFEHLYMEFPTINQTFNWTWNDVTQDYSINLFFTTEGDYPYIIWSDYPLGVMENITGTLKVRCPCYITLNGYLFSNQSGTQPYKNIHAYVGLEPISQRQSGMTGSRNPYDKQLEDFLTPLTFSHYPYKMFHAPYTNGQAVVKLWDKNVTYGIRLFDGEVTFKQGVYSTVNATKLYRTNIFLGSQKFECLAGTNEAFDYYFTTKELHPFTWLFNWIFLILIIFTVVIAGFLLFMSPMIAMPFGVGGVVLLCIIRIVLWVTIG
jgi:hypothetical protein